MAERKKFKILYPKDYWNEAFAGKPYRPPQGAMVMMSNGGVFYLVEDVNGYMTTCRKLSEVLFKYDVIWK